MRYRVTRIGHGFEVVFGDDKAEIIPDHTLISYRAGGLPGVLSGISGQEASYLTVSEETLKSQLLNAPEKEI
jgi:hypothetical protein